MQEYIIRTAVSGAVQGALESFGTPNLLLQTELTMVPDLIISPQPLQPVVLYQGSFAMSGSQSISLNNTGNVTVDYQVQRLLPIVHSISAWSAAMQQLSQDSA